jgi:hypothetical protein
MSKGLISGFERFFTKDRLTIFVVFGVLVFFLAWYSGFKYNLGDSMESGNYPGVYGNQAPRPSAPSAPTNNAPPADKKNPASGAVQPVANAGGYSSHAVANPSDLLPSDKNSKWASLNPVNQGNVNTPDLLQAGYHIGLDTIGQTLKNPNLQLRSDPIIPKKEIGPWNQSTYEPDLMRVPLEVGCGPQ